MDFKVIYEDNDVLVVDKPAGIVTFHETQNIKHETRSLIELLLEKYPELKNVGEAPRCGIVHRLDKDTSGILLVARNNKTLLFLQNQFKNRLVEKKYIALATGRFKEDKGAVETLIGRSPADPRKQKAYAEVESLKLKVKRKAITEYRVLQRFAEYALLEVMPKTGRKHQIRCHLAYIHHPIAGDKLYGFKDSPKPKNLNRQFLHASYLKVKMPDGRVSEFNAELPEDFKQVLKEL